MSPGSPGRNNDPGFDVTPSFDVTVIDAVRHMPGGVFLCGCPSTDRLAIDSGRWVPGRDGHSGNNPVEPAPRDGKSFLPIGPGK